MPIKLASNLVMIPLPPIQTGDLPTTANQGVDPLLLYQALGSFLTVASGLREDQIVLWFGGSRPIFESDDMIWFSPSPEEIDESPGPGRWGNRFDLSVDIHIVSRDFTDPSQIDFRRIIAHDIYRWRIINSIQNVMLFTSYIPQDPVKDWAFPHVESGAFPLSTGMMRIAKISIDRTQKEEGTIESILSVRIPAVLSLNLNVFPV